MPMRMQKLYDLIKSELSVADLFLLTSSPNRLEAVKHPFFEKIKKANIGKGFNSIDTSEQPNYRKYFRMRAANNAFEIFKKFALMVMKDKAKE